MKYVEVEITVLRYMEQTQNLFISSVMLSDEEITRSIETPNYAKYVIDVVANKR